MIIHVVVKMATYADGLSQEEKMKWGNEKYDLWKKEGINVLMGEATKIENKIIGWQMCNPETIAETHPSMTKEELEKTIKDEAVKWQEALDKVSEKVEEVFGGRKGYKIEETGIASLNTLDLAERFYEVLLNVRKRR